MDRYHVLVKWKQKMWNKKKQKVTAEKSAKN